MPNYTDNLGLIQPLGSEKIRIAQINQNMDTLDEAVGAVGDKSLQQQILDIGGGIAIMANGNTHPAITAGQFVFVRNHGTLADGAYTANSNIAENAALSSSNLTAVPGGGFNALKAGITSLSDQIGNKQNTLETYISGNIASISKTLTPGQIYLFYTSGGDRTLTNAEYGFMGIAVATSYNVVRFGTIFNGSKVTLNVTDATVTISAATTLVMGYTQLQ